MFVHNHQQPTMVFVALPGRPGNCMSAGLLKATHEMGEGFGVCLKTSHLSLLTTNFNMLWCEALNKRQHGITHFCMIHDDVVPEPGFLAILLDEYRRLDADVLSVCLPIKDNRGLTSTGVMDWETRKMRKLSLTEVHKRPTSFTAAQAGHPGKVLLMNTGLWLCDIRKPWAERIEFRQYDSIVRQADGDFRPVSVSEDWLFSIDCARLGLSCYATTCVKAVHQGSFEYPNFTPWGSCESEDLDDSAIAWNINPPIRWGLPREQVGIPQVVKVSVGEGVCRVK